MCWMRNRVGLYRQLSYLLTNAGMNARKWLSNPPKVLSENQIQDRKSEVDRDQLPCTKPASRSVIMFTFREHATDNNMLYTKRNFLKNIATPFDPVGFLAPITTRAKILLQDMWTAGLEWDDELTEPLISCARA